jgi:hypothetical protein
VNGDLFSLSSHLPIARRMNCSQKCRLSAQCSTSFPKKSVMKMRSNTRTCIQYIIGGNRAVLESNETCSWQRRQRRAHFRLTNTRLRIQRRSQTRTPLRRRPRMSGRWSSLRRPAPGLTAMRLRTYSLNPDLQFQSRDKVIPKDGKDPIPPTGSQSQVSSMSRD